MNQRKRYSSQKKVNILRECFEQNVAGPAICAKYRIPPHQFYRWKIPFFEKAADVFNTKHEHDTERKKIT